MNGADNQRAAGFIPAVRTAGINPAARFAWALTMVMMAWCAGPAAACNVPVFRFALERWPPHKYEFVIFHEGPWNELERTLIESLRKYADRDDCPTNFTLEVVDLDKKDGLGNPSYEKPDPKLVKLFQSQKNPKLPWLVVRYPDKADAPANLHEGPLDGPILQKLFDSPARRTIVRRILEGQTAVWVFIESGNKDKDDARFTLLGDQIARLQKELQLPKPTDTPKDKLQSDVKLKIEFSILKVGRRDPKEEVLVKMLLGMEEGIDKPGEPTVVPIYGRGVGLYGLVGKGINADTIGSAARFLIGPCTCEIKEGNPGIDLLMTADWEGGLQGRLSAEPELPALTSLFPIRTMPADIAPETRPPDLTAPESRTTVLDAAESGNYRLWRNIVLALGGAGILILVGSMLVFARKK